MARFILFPDRNIISLLAGSTLDFITSYFVLLCCCDVFPPFFLFSLLELSSSLILIPMYSISLSLANKIDGNNKRNYDLILSFLVFCLVVFPSSQTCALFVDCIHRDIVTYYEKTLLHSSDKQQVSFAPKVLLIPAEEITITKKERRLKEERDAGEKANTSL